MLKGGLVTYPSRSFVSPGDAFVVTFERKIEILGKVCYLGRVFHLHFKEFIILEIMKHF